MGKPIGCLLIFGLLIKKVIFLNGLNVLLVMEQMECYMEKQTNQYFTQDPYRQFYLSVDLDLTKIKTNSKFLKTLFSTINFIKIPAPALEYNTKNGFKFHYLHF